MKCLSSLSILCLLIGARTCLNAATSHDGHTLRIIGGAAVDIKRAPYLVSLRHKMNHATPFEHRCSGTIYSHSLVLTTATCVIGLEARSLQIVAGTSYRTQNDGYVYLVDKYRIHPEYNIWLNDNDLALVYLAFDLIKSSPLRVAPIAVAAQLPNAGSVASIAGWGADSAQLSYTENLQWAEVGITSEEQCRQSYGAHRITMAMICAGSVGHQSNASVCIGDAGGALVVNGAVVGLVSWSFGCGYKDLPGVYTNVVHLKKWIDQEALQL